MKRRKFLRIAGTSGVILAATGIGAGAFVATRSPVRALAPWSDAGLIYPDPLRNALSFAILAPNPHNRQPWLVNLNSDTEAVLSCDLNRLLPETDPFDRQIVIGLGCFIELFAQAAAQLGYRGEVELFPQGPPIERLDNRPVATLKLLSDSEANADPLFAHALDRRTNRNPYDLGRPVSSKLLDTVQAVAGPDVSVGGTSAGGTLTQLRELARLAFRGELTDPSAYQESVDLMRIGRREIEATPDGIFLGGPLLESLKLLGLLNKEQLSDPTSEPFKIGLDMADEQATTAMGFVWINTAGNSRGEQIAAGRAYMRIALQASASGLAMQPMSQALQEYPAMQPYYQQVHGLLATAPNERVQMLARVGFADSVKPAPRWSLATRTRTA